MVNRKRTALEADLLAEPLPSTSHQSRRTREMQGDGGDGKKHSIDSDEEEDVKDDKYEVLKDDDIEGQEDETIDNDGEVKITPFNLKEEQEEGEFAADGAFIWKKTTELKDAWLENIDWVKVKEVTAAEKTRNDASDDAEDEAEAAYNETESYKSVLSYMKPEETVAKAIRRLSGATSAPGQQKMVQQKQRKIAQKLKRGQKLTPEEEAFQKSREKMAELTGLADAILSRSGNMEIYEETYEKITFMLKEKESVQKTTSIPEGVDEDDALDMFAESLDKDEQPAAKEEVKGIDIDSEVKWEFRWEDTEDAEIHGPHSSTEMLKWQESGFFDKGVFVRKVGTRDFLNGKRIDFDLYT